MPTVHGLPLPPSGVVIDGSEVLWVDKEIAGNWFTYQFTVAEVVATLGGGTVSSVGLSLPAMFTVSSSPVTTTGTLTAVLANQAANKFLIGPASGAAAPPTFRLINWNNDLPLYSTVSSTSGLDGDEHILVEKGSTFLQTTTRFLASLLLYFTNVFQKNQSVAPVIVSTSGTYTPDASLTNNWQITMTGNLTLANPTNLTAGMMLNFCLDEDGTGGRTITLGNLFKFDSGTVPTWITTASAKNFISGYYDGSIIRCGAGVGFA